MTGRPNVIFVVLDTVRADRVSALGYDRPTTPQFDRFAAEATLYTDAVSQAPWSVPSHASMFTGRYPSDHGATTTAPVVLDEEMLPSLLSDAGYETYAVSPNEYVRPATGFGRGFDEFHTPGGLTEPSMLADLIGPAVNWVTSSRRLRRPVERLFNTATHSGSMTSEHPPGGDEGVIQTITEILGRAEEPFFLFCNLLDAHLPRSPDPAHYDRFVDDALDDIPVIETERAHTFGEAELDDRGFEKLSQLYDADLRTLDDRFGLLLDALREAELLEESLVVVVSDHGEHLGEFGLVGHQFSVLDSTVSVPLAISYPGGGPDRVTAQVETRRLFETVLDETDVRSLPERSLRSGRGDDTARGSYHSPMVDIEALVRDGIVQYDPALLGEPLTFRRAGGAKQISFDGTSWLFPLPEWSHEPIEQPTEQVAELPEQ